MRENGVEGRVGDRDVDENGNEDGDLEQVQEEEGAHGRERASERECERGRGRFALG